MPYIPPTPLEKLQMQVKEQAKQIDDLKKQINPSTQEATKETKFKVGDIVYSIEWDKFIKIVGFTELDNIPCIFGKEGDKIIYCKISKITGRTEQPKPQIKYRKNGALVFAPKLKNTGVYGQSGFYFITDTFEVEDVDCWDTLENELKYVQQGLVFDNQQACQLWADKLKMAYALKQRIVEAESKNEDLEYCYISFYLPENKKEYSFEQIFPMITPSVLTVSTNAKDILMSDEVSDEEFKAFIEVFSF